MPEKTVIVLVLLVIPVVLIGALLFFTPDTLSLPLPNGSDPNLMVIKVKDNNIRVAIADTKEERERGLSGRERLSENQGMLFVFDKPGFFGIWMKDMRFPIDILWLDQEGKVVDLEQNAAPESYPEVFYPSRQASYVLELSANYTELYSVNVGDKVTLPETLQK